MDNKKHKSRGYGFVSFKDVDDYTRAFREMNGKYLGSRPLNLRRSNTESRTVTKTAAKKLIKSGKFSVDG